MRTLFTLAVALLTTTLFAQTEINKKYPVKKGEELVLKFDYPQLVKITTWNQNAVQITGKVNINNGENDASFKLTDQSSNNQKVIEGKVNDYKSLPQRVTAEDGKEKMVFNSVKEYSAYQDKSNKKFTKTVIGAHVDIVLEIKVPKNMITKIESTYGTVEVNSFDGPLVAKSTYGGVDTTIQPKQLGEITIETFFGKVYTNVDLPLQKIKDSNFHHIVSAHIGQGPKQEYYSKYGNVYVRE